MYLFCLGSVCPNSGPHAHFFTICFQKQHGLSRGFVCQRINHALIVYYSLPCRSSMTTSELNTTHQPRKSSHKLSSKNSSGEGMSYVKDTASREGNRETSNPVFTCDSTATCNFPHDQTKGIHV